MAVKLPENNRHWTTNWEFRVSDKPPTTNVYAGHGDFSGTTTFHKDTLYGKEVDGRILGDHANTGEKPFLKPEGVLRSRDFSGQGTAAN